MTQPNEDVTLPPAHDPDATLAPEATQPASVDARAPAGYVIERELGRGGMGVVYLARALKLDRLCALKMILAGAHSGATEVERFLTEAQAIARLQHPGIVQVFEVGEHDGKPFMALEYCGGGSLAELLARNPLTPQAAAELVQALAEALHATHAAGVLHRDLKPANVLLTAEWQPKITDFGLAKKLDEDGATRTGSVMGTPSYMPPEQADGQKDIGPAADIYALGAILYECLASRPPFRAATALDTLLQVLHDEPVPLRQFNAKVAVDLETIVHKCLQKDPQKRYRTAQDLADDLGRYLDGTPVQARPVGGVERGYRWVQRNPAVSTLLAAAVLALIVGVAASWVLAGWALSEASAARTAESQAGADAVAARAAEAAAKQSAQAEAAAKSLAQGEAARAEREQARAEGQLRRAEWSAYAGKLLLAQAAFSEDNVPEAVRHLEECQWNLRGWEHGHLRWKFAGGKPTRLGHPAGVTGVCFSPDGTRILTGSQDKTARVWDAATGQEVLALKGHTDKVTSVAWSPDGKRLLTGSEDATARVWDAATGMESAVLRNHAGAVRGVCFSPDGKRILSGSSYDSTACVWDAAQGTVVFSLKEHVGGVWSVAFSPDGKRILTGGMDKTARVWDAEKRTRTLVLKGHGPLLVAAVAFSPDGRHLLTGGYDGTARVWDAATGVEAFALRGPPAPVWSVAFSPDGRRVLTGSGDFGKAGEARVWDAEKGTELLTLKGHTAPVHGVAFSHDGTRIVTGSGDRTARVWGSDRGAGTFVLKGHTDNVRCVAFSPDGKRLLTAGADITARVWDVEKGHELFALRGHVSEILSVAFSPDGTRLLTGGIDKTARVWDAEKGVELLALQGHTGWVTRVAFSPDGKRILTSGDDRTARVWDTATGRAVFVLRGEPIDLSVSREAAYSPDGTRILTWGAAESTPAVWDAQTGRVVFALRGHTGQVTSAAYNSDGTRILTGSWDRTAKVWDADKGIEVCTLKGHTELVKYVAFGRGGKTAFAWDDRDKVRAWDAGTGQLAAADNPPARLSYGAAISPTGRFSARPDGYNVQVVDLLPTAGPPERQRYHGEQATLAEKEQQWFAVAFHVGRLLLDDPDNAALKKRREDALQKHAAQEK